MKKRTEIIIDKKRLAAAVMAVMMLAAGASCGSSDTGGSRAKSEAPMVQENAADDYDGGMVMMNAPMSTEEYAHTAENAYISTAENPLSTFSTDVDTASYTNVRRMLEQGSTVDPDAVRTEEFINYFRYSYPAPQPGDEDKLSVYTELSDCPWNNSAKLLQIGLQAQDVEVKDIDSNIVFLIDVSGSMYTPDKLPLVQEAFKLLAENLGTNDRISIVTYAGDDKVVLEGEEGSNFDKIAEALDGLRAGGGTAGAAGINTAYDLAERFFIEGGNNRVILATDGDLNIGVSSVEGLTSLIESKRDKGIFLSVLGFGTGNYKDNRLEALADNGNGNYAYIDTIDEARRVLVTEMSGTLFTVAKDAKIQVEFDPERIEKYKLVGYENRLLDDKDFEDDTKDAGDIGAGQQVTALYELIPAKTDEGSGLPAEGNIARVSVRCKGRDENESRLIENTVDAASYTAPEEMSDNMKLACSAAMFAKMLRDPQSGITPDLPLSYAAKVSTLDKGDLISLISKLDT